MFVFCRLVESQSSGFRRMQSSSGAPSSSSVTTSSSPSSSSSGTSTSQVSILTNNTAFFASSGFLQTCPPQITYSPNPFLNGRSNVLQSNLFQLNTPSVVFDVSQEINPTQVTITFWYTTGKVVQILSGVQTCSSVNFDSTKQILIMSCSTQDVHLFSYQNSGFVLFQIFQHQNIAQITDVQLQPNTPSQTQFASLCFLESELRFWVSGSILPIRTVYLHIPSSNDMIPSAFKFIFIPYTKYIAVFDINKSILRLVDIDVGDIQATSNKYLKTIVPLIENFIQYSQLWKLIVVHTIERQLPAFIENITTFFANDTTLYSTFRIVHDNEYDGNRVTCMHVIQGCEMVALGNKDGSIAIYNFILGQKIRQIQVSVSEVLAILQSGNVLNILSKDVNDETMLTQYDWSKDYYVEVRDTNQAQCVNSCDTKQYQASHQLACRSCNSAFNCATCDSNGCTSCSKGYYQDTVTLSNGTIQNTCVNICSANLFGLGYDNSSDTECVEICPSNIYNIISRICSLSTTIDDSSSEETGLTATLRQSTTSDTTVLVDFGTGLTFNTAHILASTSQVVTSISQCLVVTMSKIKTSDFTCTVTLDESNNTYISLALQYTGSGGVVNPQLTVKFEGQTCFKDSNYVPLGPNLVSTGLTLTLPWNLINYNNSTKQTSETIGSVAKGAATTVAAASFPLVLTNVMYIFWILINVFQLVNFLLYLNVNYPINITNFFRAFKAFNMDFLPTFGLKFNSSTQKYTFLGNDIVDQVAAAPFQRESMTSSFFLNGLKFLQTFFILYIVLFIVRIIARNMKVNCRAVPEDAGFFHKLIALAQQKLEFTTIITTHQSALLQFSVSIFLQMMGFSSANAMNVIAFIVSLFALVYLLFFLKNCYQKVNLNEMIVGSKISDKLVDDKLKDKYEKYKLQYGVLYWNVNFIFYGRRNYHVFMMFKQVFIPFVVVFLNQFTFVCIFILIVMYTLNVIFLILYRPFDKKLIGYLSAANDSIMTIILCLIFYIHVINQSAGSTLTSADVDKQMNIGWVIISMLLVLFLANIISGIAMEWDSIKEAINNLKQKLREYTKSNSVDFSDKEEKMSLNSYKSGQFNYNEEKRNNLFKDSIKKKQRTSTDNDAKGLQQHQSSERVKNFSEVSMQELSELNESQTMKPLNEQHSPQKKAKKKAKVSQQQHGEKNPQQLQKQQQQQKQYDSNDSNI